MAGEPASNYKNWSIDVELVELVTLVFSVRDVTNYSMRRISWVVEVLEECTRERSVMKVACS